MTVLKKYHIFQLVKIIEIEWIYCRKDPPVCIFSVVSVLHVYTISEIQRMETCKLIKLN